MRNGTSRHGRKLADIRPHGCIAARSSGEEGGAALSDLIRSVKWPGKQSVEEILDREWIVTNGIGGYASGTVAGVITRRFHGLLISAVPSPYGRRMFLNDVSEQIRFPDGRVLQLGGEHRAHSDVRVY